MTPNITLYAIMCYAAVTSAVALMIVSYQKQQLHLSKAVLCASLWPLWALLAAVFVGAIVSGAIIAASAFVVLAVLFITCVLLFIVFDQAASFAKVVPKK